MKEVNSPPGYSHAPVLLPLGTMLSSLDTPITSVCGVLTQDTSLPRLLYLALASCSQVRPSMC